MSITDEKKIEAAKVKQLPFDKKVEHYMYYYKRPAIITAILVFIFGSFIHSYITQKELAFYGVFINANASNDVNELQAELDEFLAFDTEEYETVFDDSVTMGEEIIDEAGLATQQKLAALITASEVEVIASDAETFVGLMYGEYLGDLRNFFSAEELAMHEDKLFYMDIEMLELLNYLTENPGELENYEIGESDPKKPELMLEPVPVGILVDSTTKLASEYRFSSSEIVVGIVVNTKRGEAAKSFINMALETK